MDEKIIYIGTKLKAAKYSCYTVLELRRDIG